MRCGIDFSRSPAQRRRAREQSFYRLLAAALLLGGSLAALPGLRISLHTASLQQANALLTAELQTLSPQAKQTATLRTRITALEKQLKDHQQLGRRRQQAARLLRAAAQAAQASRSQVRLQRILLQGDRGELRGQAPSAQEVRDFAAALLAAGLEGTALHDLHAEEGGYAFILAIPLAAPLPASQEAAP
jgi:Tfp pilus assembly protein PilN